MENAQNKGPQSKANQTTQGNTQSNTSSTSNLGGSQSGSGMSNQSGTSGKGGLNNITQKLQEFSNTTMSKVNGLSTTQKVVGGSLLALGAGWLTMNSMNKNKAKTGKSNQPKSNLNQNKNMNKR